MNRLIFVIATALYLVVGSLSISAKPGKEGSCSAYSDNAFGLCNAYCEALNCDDPGSKRFGSSACEKVLENFTASTGALPLCIDADTDGVADSDDNCPSTPNMTQSDSDADGVGDVCDVCPDVADPGQEDSNNNGIGDACEVSFPGVDPDDPYYDRFEGIGFYNQCSSDADVVIGGCSAEVCAAEPVLTTCETLPYLPPGSCSCNDGTAEWVVP